MQIEYLNLVKIDHENNTVSEQPLNDEGNLREYVMEIIGIITDIFLRPTPIRHFRLYDTQKYHQSIWPYIIDAFHVFSYYSLNFFLEWVIAITSINCKVEEH